jgi:hypothetical protein
MNKNSELVTCVGNAFPSLLNLEQIGATSGWCSDCSSWSDLMTNKLLLAGVAALTLGGATMTTTSADAQTYYGPGAGWGGSPYGGYWGGHRGYGYRGAYGYRPVGYYGGYGRPYYRRHANSGAVAAGLVGGLALGAIAANAARPAYYYSAPVATSCWIERRRAFDQFGRRVITRVQVCG